MQEGFLTDIDTMMLFFRVCSRYKIDDKEGRIALLRELTRRKKVKYLRDPKEYLQGKNVIEVRKKEK